jgi:ribonucleoside-diphosphate reductase alpha chain
MEENSRSSEEFCEFNIDDVDVVPCYTRKIRFGCGNMYLRVNVINMRPVRVFIAVGKTGCCQRALLEAIGRLVTIMLERGDPLNRIVHTLIGIRCDSASMGSARTNDSGEREVCASCMDALARELRDFCKVGET